MINGQGVGWAVRQGLHVLHSLAQAKKPCTDSPRSVPELSDINMPGTDGLELLRRLRRLRPDLPVLMVTAYGDNERRVRADKLGAAAFFIKPVDFDQLKQQLAQLIRPLP